MKLHTISLWFLYSLTIFFTGAMIVKGGSYYATPMIERPHHELHQNWKPGGIVGHGVGIVGSAMMLLLLLYSMRKRSKKLRNLGKIRYWLNYHIWLGITGTILVIFHTSFKIGGIIAISFWSMIAVALSGVLGRYIYMQIPRSISGAGLSMDDLKFTEGELIEHIRSGHTGDITASEVVEKILVANTAPITTKGVVAVFSWIWRDLSLNFSLYSARKHLKKNSMLSSIQVKEIFQHIKKLIVLRRRRAVLKQARNLLHYWHVAHKPFAIVMLIIMSAHVVITVLFGYKWIF